MNKKNPRLFLKISCLPVSFLYLLGADSRLRRARAPWFERLAGICRASALFIADATHAFPFSASCPLVSPRRRRNTV